MKVSNILSHRAVFFNLHSVKCESLFLLHVLCGPYCLYINSHKDSLTMIHMQNLQSQK